MKSEAERILETETAVRLTELPPSLRDSVEGRALAAEEQRDELRSQLAKRTFERDDASQSCDVMQAERDRALSELADARKDKELLEKRVVALESEMNPQDVCDVDARLRRESEG